MLSLALIGHHLEQESVVLGAELDAFYLGYVLLFRWKVSRECGSFFMISYLSIYCSCKFDAHALHPQKHRVERCFLTDAAHTLKEPCRVLRLSRTSSLPLAFLRIQG